MPRRVLVPIVALLAASAAAAQDATDDWEVVRVPDSRTMMAASRFDSGLLVGVRCTDGRLEVMISGLPPVSERTATRPVGFAFGEQEAALNESSWWVSAGRNAIFYGFPARLARELREGGRMQVRIPGVEGQPTRRYVMDIPPSPGLIDEVLTACARPLIDPRDVEVEALSGADLPVDLEWTRTPDPEYPDRRRVYERGYAAVSCLAQPDGRVDACQIESEHPADGQFGEAALAGLRRARVGVKGLSDQPVPPRVITFTTNFRMASEAESAERETERPSRLPARSDR